MEKWPCPHCEEELLGAVNRCWKCGKRVQPPITAAIVEEKQLPAEVEVPSTTQVVLLTHEELAVAAAKEPPRRGSPFAFEAAVVERHPNEPYYGDGAYRRDTSKPKHKAPLMPHYPRHSSAIGGVTAAIILGVMSLLMLRFTVLGGIPAAIGVGCAVWGLYSPKKGLAMAALIFCCLVLAMSAWILGFYIYSVYIAPLSAGGAAAGGA